MHRTLILAPLLVTAAWAQTPLDAERVPAPVRDAGIYHVASGTWTRSAGATAALGADVIYRNDAPSGYFMNANAGHTIVDEGVVPGTTSPFGGDRDTYEVSCFEVGYCSDANAGTHRAVFRFFDSYSPCDDILQPAQCLNEVADVLVTALPGGAGSVACWTVTLDLSGGREFCFEADGGPCNPGYDDVVVEDSFGWSVVMLDAEGTNTGPLICGDPDWTLAVPGATWGGGGTYYGGSTPCGSGETGLLTYDLFHFPESNLGYVGCHFFGGYQNNNGCGARHQNPFGSFHFVLFANSGPCDGPCDDCTCSPALDHSGGLPARMYLVHDTGAAFPGKRLEVIDGPPGEFGYVLVSASTTAPMGVGQGQLCLGAPIGRYNAQAAQASGSPGLNSVGQFDGGGVFVNAAGTSSVGTGFDLPTALPSPPGGALTVGSTWHFQCWFRDGQGSNLSNAVGITLE